MRAIREDLTTRAAYVSDASIYRRVPAAVAEPSTVEEIRELLALARERGWPVTCRGGGTSVAGNAIGDGLVVDLSRHFNRILSIDPDAMTATVEPGVVCDTLRAAAAEFGLTYGPDPSTHSRCTIGGMVANNACGSHSVAWGTSADNLVAVTVMLADGSEVSLGPGGTSDARITRELRAIRDRNLAVLRTELGQFPRQVSGYGLHHLLSENGFDAAKAFAGSEGTCGIITRLTVRLVRKPAHTALAVLGFADAFEAAAAAPSFRVPGVYTIEGMGADLIEALQARPGQAGAGSQLPRGGGWLYCEVGAETADGALERAGQLAELVADRLVDSAVVPEGPGARALWAIREAGAGIATRLPDGGEAWPGWEDSAVPPARLGEYLRDLSALMDEHDYAGIPFGHFGEGCVHLRISFDLASDDGVARYRSFIRAAAELVHRYGGSVSGEHGDGRARSELLSTIYSPAALRAFSDFKRVFDPDGVFNPGVLVDPEPIDQGIRPGPGARTFDVAPVQAFSRDGGSFARAVNRCVGVGACRSDAGAMCPSFQVTRDEVHSTRGRARSLAEMLRGESITDGWKSKETLEALDLCLSCKACVAECPVNVDMATYKAEFLNRHYRSGLLAFVGPGRRPLAHFTMGWMPYLVRFFARVPGAVRAVNWLESFAPIEALTKRLGGIEPRRRMISFVPQSLTAWVRRRDGTARGGDPAVDRGPDDARETVVLWPDTFTNYSADAPGRAAVEALEAMGYRVLIPRVDACCGLTWHSTGQLDQAKKVLGQTLDVVEPLLAAGHPILGLEPSCTAMLQHEIAELLPDDARAARVTELAVGFGTFVARHLDAGKAWPFRSLAGDGGSGDGTGDGGVAAAVCQVHCHQKALGEGADGYGPELRVLGRLGVATSVVGGGCCGLAGNWGFEPGHFELSQRLGERELFPAVRAAAPETIIVADGFSCRTQIAQGTDREGVHLAEVLRSALAR
ncbi:FAD-binding and (Fe-S)-binding domain-containing protein [Sinomonas sp. ASV322]|uniref:FAD-binding and (Fe-S)-binding domain-containing protein n=1 Tax=Sinomonas sp. ASV322 TaxID=3041920 RepID=UPI0027DC36E8|nr:FAD-binding and (Fe-S)-binding domain-containing protein [Sinomonas sp. ASV322]MDQ4501558.1 FAD-binding and (Fe-S)-binding domain-containing protein [Sinomonas sp. ASV322]